MLDTVAKDGAAGFENIAQRAILLKQKIGLAKSAEEQREYCKVANGILGEYIAKAIETKTQDQHKFNHTMNMTLTDETIQKNKEFFNGLFQKHGIDYKI